MKTEFEKKLELVNALKGCAYELWRASLCAGPGPGNLFDELKNPKVGDLVMEVTTHGMRGRDPIEGIGTLVAHGRAPCCANRKEARAAGYEDDESIPEHEYFDVCLDFDDGRLFRWSNASFIKVKTERPTL